MHAFLSIVFFQRAMCSYISAKKEMQFLVVDEMLERPSFFYPATDELKKMAFSETVWVAPSCSPPCAR